MLMVRSFLFSTCMLLLTLIYGVLSVLSFPFPYRWRYTFITQWTHINLWLLKTICGLHYEVEGRENIPARNGIILCKHQSAWETLALQQIFPPQTWILKRELLWIPLLGWGLAMLEPVAIDRKSTRRALQQIITEGAKRLAAGRWLVIFPEGTRVAPGTKGRYAPGGALLAERSGYPVIPVAHNAGEFWPRHSFVKRPGLIRIVIGPLIESTGRDAAEINTLVEVWIEKTMQELISQAVPLSSSASQS